MPGSCNALQQILLKVPMKHLWAIFNSFRERLFQNVQYLTILILMYILYANETATT